VIHLSINEIWPFIISPIIGFLLGGFPTAYIVVKLVTGIDPREFGSGSVSTRNTVRAAGVWPWGAIVYGVDVSKGMLAAAIVEYAIPDTTYTEYYVILAAVFAVAGHCWMPYMGFKGGKGLGTYVGLLFYIYWPTAFFWILIMFALIRLSGFSGTGATWAATFVTPFWFLIELFTDPVTPAFRFGLPGAFMPHEYLLDGFGWQFILLYAFSMWLVLLLRHLPEFKKIRLGESKSWQSLKRTELMK
jgi:glycerol-3-phosphate acyltransferase PlsY